MNKAYKEITETICNYCKKEETDFALMLSGEWGKGKTYFVKNILKEKLEENDFSLIYISLNGLTNPQSIKRKILYFKLIEKFNLNIDINFADEIIELGANIKNNIFSNIYSLLTGLGWRKILSEINFKDKIVILDDLERISENLKLKDVLGYVFDNIIDKNIKVIFIANEQHILEKDKGFNKIKEKSIQRIIDFNPEFEFQIEQFISSKLKKNEELKKYLNNNIETITRVLKATKHENLRTIGFLISIFEDIYELKSKEIVNKNINDIFISTLLLVVEYRIGNIDISNSDDFAGLDNIYRVDLTPILLEKPQKKNDEKKSYAIEFKKLYVERLGLNFKFLKSIFEYVLIGFFDSKDFIEEVENIFKQQSKWEIAFFTLMNYKDNEIDVVLESFNIVMENVLKGNFSFYNYLRIYSLLWHILDLNIFNKKDIPKNIDQIFIDGLIKASKTKNLNFSHNSIPYIEKLFDQRVTSESGYQKLEKKKNQILFEKKNNDLKEKYKSFLESLNTDDNKIIWPLYDKLDESHLFENLLQTNNQCYLLKLNNRGIFWIECMLKEYLLDVSNAGQFKYGEKEPLEKIKLYLEENIPKNNFDKLRLNRFKNLIEMMNKSIEHLEKTK